MKLAKPEGMKVVMEEIDVSNQAKKHNMLQKRNKELYLGKIARGEYAAVIASPPGSTFSRVRWANRKGPRPIRCARHLRGFPRLSWARKKEVENANALIDLVVDAFQTQLSLSSAHIALLGHPEDLGLRLGGGNPGSIWRWPEIEALMKYPGMTWGALHQCDWGRPYKKPTRLLGRLEGLGEILASGAPRFDEKGFYVGPLPATGPADIELVGKAESGFKTGPSAAWPPALCERLAQLTLQHWMKHKEKLILKTGGCRQLQPPTRRKITKEELAQVGEGRLDLAGKVYIGRGRGSVPRSPFANPFKVDIDGTRSGVVSLFEIYSREVHSDSDIKGLSGKVLLCHCDPNQLCHGDVFISRFKRIAENATEDPAPTIELDTAGSSMAPVEGKCPQGTQPPAVLPCVDEGPVPNRGWLGRGPARTSSFMGRGRTFEDGGGLCSPGKWPPSRRNLPDCIKPDFMDQAKAKFCRAIREHTRDSDDSMGFMLKLATGRIETLPFSEKDLEEMRDHIWETFNVPAEMRGVPERQVFRLGTISKILETYGDPDSDFVWGLREGVPIGYDEVLPRTPAVFPPKEKWKLGDPEEDDIHDRENYKSVEGHQAEVEAQFREEAKTGWMREYSDEDAANEFGDRLFVASLGVVVEPGKIRVVHDASHGVHVNHRIKVRDQLHSPGAGEIRTLLGEARETGGKTYALLGDVRQAHRRVKIVKRDWGLQACRLKKGTLWVNTVGTYGVGSAGYYWGRLGAAVLVRLPHYFLAGRWYPELLLYADDFLYLAKRISEITDLGTIVMIFAALGVPMKWSKFRGGFQVSWIGYWIDLEKYLFGISEKRAEWLAAWLEDGVKNFSVDLRDLQAVLGRLCFTMGPLEYLRPFVTPIYSWSASVGCRGRTKLPWSLAFIYTVLIEALRGPGRTVEVRPRALHLGEAFRADAKAEGMDVVVGGWETLGGVDPKRARWYSVRLTRTSAPWAFSRGEPYRTIAALELFATVLSIVAFSGRWPKCATGSIALSGATDNGGNSFVVTRMMTSKFPLVVVLAELAFQLRDLDLDLSLGWVPRDQNTEADALSNESWDDFDVKNRVHLDLAAVPWKVLPRYMAAAEDLYQQIQKNKVQKPDISQEQRIIEKGGRKRLREREPWAE